VKGYRAEHHGAKTKTSHIFEKFKYIFHRLQGGKPRSWNLFMSGIRDFFLQSTTSTLSLGCTQPYPLTAGTVSAFPGALT
jgi:hypothetical protein